MIWLPTDWRLIICWTIASSLASSAGVFCTSSARTFSGPTGRTRINGPFCTTWAST